MPEFLNTIKDALNTAALAAEGQHDYDATRKRVRYHDGVRERTVGGGGYQPYAYPVGGGPQQAYATAQALAAAGGTLAVPFTIDGSMLLESVSFWNTDAATARGPVEFALYEDRLGNANALPILTGAVGSLASWTPTVAAIRTITATGGPIYIPPGCYWLTLKNNHATVTLGLASAAAGTMAGNVGQTKTLTTSAFGATLDLVAATWTKVTWLPAIRLNGRSFGVAAAF
jgi:hypothetical protein